MHIMTLCLVLLLQMHVMSLPFSPGVLQGWATGAGKVDVQSALTFLGEKHLGSSGLDTRVSVSPGLRFTVERKPLNTALTCY